MFSAITLNWRGRPLKTHEVVVETIAATTTKTGLSVHAALDTNTYQKGIRITDKAMKAFEAAHLQRHTFHGNWNRAGRALASGIVHCASYPSSLRAREKSTRYERGSLPVSPVISSSAAGTASATAGGDRRTVAVVALGSRCCTPARAPRRRARRGGDHHRPGDVLGVHQRPPRGAVRSSAADRVRQHRVARPGCSARCPPAAAGRTRTPWRCASTPARKSASASAAMSSSTRTFDSAYGVTGLSGASSPTSSSPDCAPYTEHVEA